MDPHLLMDLADSLHRERLARVEAYAWQFRDAPPGTVVRRPRETLALALVALAVRLAPSVAVPVQPRAPSIPRA